MFLGFPYTFPGDEDTAGPSVTFTVPAGAIHERRTVQVYVEDDGPISYVRIEAHYPTGYFEVVYESTTGFGRFYGSSLLDVLDPAGDPVGLAENAGPGWPGNGDYFYPLTGEGFPITGDYPVEVILDNGSDPPEEVYVLGRNETGRHLVSPPLANEYLSGTATARIKGSGIGGGASRTFTIVRDLHWPNDFVLKVTATDAAGNVTPL
jgi:hypothetical protein